MKLYAGFVLTNGKIEIQAVNTRDFRRMIIPSEAIGGIVIEPKEIIKSMTFGSNNIKLPKITYFGTRVENDSEMVMTRAGTIIELPMDTKLINI